MVLMVIFSDIVLSSAVFDVHFRRLACCSESSFHDRPLGMKWSSDIGICGSGAEERKDLEAWHS